MKVVKNEGITIVALVVTIVVLLILAGITIGTLTGDNGIIDKAQEAKNDTNYAQWEEKIDQAIIDAESKHRNPSMDDVTQELIAKGVIKDANQIAEDGTITTVDGTKIEGKLDDYIVPPLEPGVIVSDGPREYSQGEGEEKQTAWIPDGYMIVPGLDDINAGLVISDNAEDKENKEGTVAKGNQFVWIPVPDVIYDGSTEISKTYTPMVEKQSGTTDYQGMLYNFSGSTSTYQSEYKPGTTNYREPTLVTGNSNDTHARLSSVAGKAYDASSSYYETVLGYNNAVNFGADMQDDFNSMVESVYKYKGFYVGRYELGLEGTTPVVKNASTNSGVTTVDASNSNTKYWYGLYSKCKEFASEDSNKSVVSSMIWGSQYDAMLNWMAKQGETVGTGNTNKRNSTKVTGSNTNDEIRKVFDLYGCHYEWTLEANNADHRVTRGGYSNFSDAPSYRDSNNPNVANSNGSARLTLYIK